MSTAPKHRYTVEEYLGFELGSDSKHEYHDGEIFAMVGTTPEHGLVVANVVGELRSQLKGRSCSVYPSDVRLKIIATGLYTYPDAMIVCGKARVVGPKPGALLNPRLIVEVLSSSTEDYVRGTKFAHYQTIKSFTDYLLIAQDAHHVEHFVRQPDGGWLRSEYNGSQASVTLNSIGCELPLDEIYDKVPVNL